MDATVKHLTAFQRDIIYIISDLDEPYGLGIKSALEDYYDEEVNTGRVYQNLEKLENQGYIDKTELDNRTKSYTLTPKATSAIENRYSWETSQIKKLIH